jgi:acyl carrier protein
MVPSYFVSLEKIPLTTGGKIDRKLLEVSGEKLSAGKQYVAPGNNKEKIIARVWQEVLKHDRIGINDNFFDLGGNSLNIIQLVVKLNELLDMEVPVVAMFEFPTVKSFSQYLSRISPTGIPHPQDMDKHTDKDTGVEIKTDRSAALDAAKKSKLKQQARRKRRNKHVQRQ